MCGAELELELIQPQMAQKPVLRGEVGARALRVRSVSREEVWASAGVQGAWVSASSKARVGIKQACRQLKLVKSANTTP